MLRHCRGEGHSQLKISTNATVDIENDLKPTHQQGLGCPKRLHTTCNAART